MPSTICKDSSSPSPRPQRIGFDDFEADLRSGELRKNGSRIRLQPQPFQLLVLLLESPGEVVTRDEICRSLWPANTFVDFERGLGAAVNKIREALNDHADGPRYIETLPKRGYRFIGKIKPEAPAMMPVAESQLSVQVTHAPVVEARRAWRWWLVLASEAAAAVALLFLVRPSHKPATPLVESQPPTPVPFTSYPGLETTPSFSPDGSRIAFAWKNDTGRDARKPGYDLYVKAIGSETLLKLTDHPSDWIFSTWSPDGTQIAFHRLATDDNGIYVVPALGGPERRLIATHTPYDVAAPLSWSPDGKWIAYADTENGRPGDRAYLLNVATLESHPFPHDISCLHEGFLTFSHRGQELALLCVHNANTFEYLITDLDGKSRRPLATLHGFISGLVWSADDQSLIVSVIVPQGGQFDEIQVRDGKVQELPVTAGAWPAISPDGRKWAFSLKDVRTSIWRRDLSARESPSVEMFSSTRPQSYGQYSPDGRHIAFNSERSGTWSVWVADSDGSNPVQISQGRPAAYPRWSPDSRKIAFSMEESSGIGSVYTADLSDRVVHKLETNIRDAESLFWSHDGKWIYFLGYVPEGHQIYRCPSGGGDATPLVAGLPSIVNAMESWDGKVLYFPFQDHTTIMALALDLPGATPQPVEQMPKVANPGQWEVAAGGIYFVSKDNPLSISFYDFATKRTRKVSRSDKPLGEGLSASPDSRYLLYSQIDEVNADIMLLNQLR